MKRILRFLPIAAIMFGCAFSFTACGGDDDNDGGGTGGDIVINGNGNNNGSGDISDSLIIANTKLLKQVDDLIFNYNEKNSLTSIKDKYGDSKLEVSYNPLTLKCTTAWDDGYEALNEETVITNIKLNANGYITSSNFNYTFKYRSNYEFDEEEQKANGSITFQYSDNNLTNVTLKLNGNYVAMDSGEKYDYNYNVVRSGTLTWKNGNLQNITINGNTNGGSEIYKVQANVNFKYGNQVNETAQFTHAYTDYLSFFFNNDLFAGLCHMNLFGETSINYPTGATVVQTDVESFDEYNYNSTLEATESYDYNTDEEGYLTSYYTEGTYKYIEDEYEGYENNYSKTTYYEYTNNSNNNYITPDSVSAKIHPAKSLKEKKFKGFFGSKRK